MTDRDGAVEKLLAELGLQNLTEGMPGGFFIYRAEGDGELLYANRAMARIFGCADMEEFYRLVNNSFRGIVHPDDYAAVDQSIVRQIAESQYDLDYVEYRIRQKDGTVRWVEDYGHFVHDPVYGDLFYVFIADEVHRESQQREMLERALEQSRMAINAKSAFLSNMSHDIRTPMNAVLGYVELARKSLDDRQKLNIYLNQIERAGNQMLRSISDVLEISRLENEASGAEEPCDLAEVLDSVRKEAVEGSRRKELEVTMDVYGLRHTAVYGDGEKIRQVLRRLMNNAVQYTPVGGRVKLRAEEHGAATRDYGAFTFTVEDNGIGIKPEAMARIFEPFERVRSTTASGVAGLGLGLTIAKSMVDLMGGTITAESTEGKGSTFTVNLGLRLRDPEPACGEEPPAPRRSGSHRILVVEDNEMNREICRELLEDAGFRVDTAENGAVAVEKVSAAPAGHYRLVLMDIQMPVMDGNQAARAIRALPDGEKAAVPIVALSANAMEEDRKRSTESGMNGHMAKPIHVAELLDMIDRVTH